MPVHAIILAAGEGTRMRSARPKVLAKLAGKPMIRHVIDLARAINVEAIHVLYGFMGTQLREEISDSDIRWIEQSERRGTGHAVRIALPYVPDDAKVLVLYGDVPAIHTDAIRELVASCDENQPISAMLVEVENPHGYGRAILVEDMLERVVEEKNASDAERQITTVNTGVLCAQAAVLKRFAANLTDQNLQKEYLLTDVFALARAEQTPVGFRMCEPSWRAFGANDATQLAELESNLRAANAAELLAQGIRLADPSRFDLRGSVIGGRDVEIDVNVILEGENQLADDIQIGPFVRLKNCRLACGTRVLSHCDLEGVTTLGPCTIGPFARLRPGTTLAANAKVGNFVETKAASIGTGSKVSHLSYIGDATLGEDVNIGAGTITCNYDGVNKHQTEIENGVFIGSNTSLVAPIKIGQGATIGAGSVITEDAPAEKLTLARATQKTHPRWTRPVKK